jgi:hypothetical protein
MKGLGLIIFASVAVLLGAGIAVAVIRKRRMDSLIDFDDFDTEVGDEEFEHFFGTGASDDSSDGVEEDSKA